MPKKNQRQKPSPCSFQQPELLVSQELFFRLQVKSPNQGLTALRFLLTKFYVRDQRLSKNEEALLYELVEYFNNLRNPSFFESQGIKWLTLQRLTSLLLKFRNVEYPSYAKAQVSLLLRNNSLMSPRAFLGLAKNFEPLSFLKRLNRLTMKQSSTKKFIGVGYRDKGSARIESFDGNPSWQTIASCHNDKVSVRRSKPPDLGTQFSRIRCG